MRAIQSNACRRIQRAKLAERVNSMRAQEMTRKMKLSSAHGRGRVTAARVACPLPESFFAPLRSFPPLPQGKGQKRIQRRSAMARAGMTWRLRAHVQARRFRVRPSNCVSSALNGGKHGATPTAAWEKRQSDQCVLEHGHCHARRRFGCDLVDRVDVLALFWNGSNTQLSCPRRRASRSG